MAILIMIIIGIIGFYLLAKYVIFKKCYLGWGYIDTIFSALLGSLFGTILWLFTSLILVLTTPYAQETKVVESYPAIPIEENVYWVAPFVSENQTSYDRTCYVRGFNGDIEHINISTHNFKTDPNVHQPTIQLIKQYAKNDFIHRFMAGMDITHEYYFVAPPEY